MDKLLKLIFLLLHVMIFMCHRVCCSPEQGVRTLKWTSLKEQGEDYTVGGGIAKSMFSGSLLSAEIACDQQTTETVKLQWYIRTVHCAEKYQLYDEDDKEILSSIIGQFRNGNGNPFEDSFYYLMSDEQTFTCNKPIRLLDYTSRNWTRSEIANQDGSSQDTDKNLKSDEDVQSETQNGEDTNNNPAQTTSKQATNIKVVTSTPKSVNRKGKVTESRRQKRETKNEPNVNKTASVKKTEEDNNVFIKVPVDGMYIFVLTASYDSAKVNLTATVKATSSYGYLSAIDFPFLPFYAVMCAVYTIFLLVWFLLCCCYRRDILRIQLWIGAVIFIGFVVQASFLGEYHTINLTGQSVPGAMIFAQLIWCVKRALSRMVVIIASVGFGIVKPRLGSTLHKVIAVGLFYFFLSAADGYRLATTHKANQRTTAALIFILILAVTDAAICWWIFTALVQTMRTLRLRRNLVKLSLYRHFTNTLIFSVIASVAFMIWSIVQHSRTACVTDWKELWVDEAFWQLLFAIILLVMMILWRPSASNQRYAYSPLSDGADEDAEEPMMNDAFEGVKMRGSKDSGNSRKHTSDQAEDDLKWIEDNIPSSMADSALPSLLDSEEEIMTTKYELSKMQ